MKDAKEQKNPVSDLLFTPPVCLTQLFRSHFVGAACDNGGNGDRGNKGDRGDKGTGAKR